MTQNPTLVLYPDKPAAFFYRRVSDVKQADSGLGEEAQLATCQDYYNHRLKPLGYQFGGDFLDSAKSARKKHFMQRKAADALNLAARKGDVIVISKMDRAWRSMRDFSNTIANWEQRGIHVAVVNCGIETWDKNKASTNKLLMGILAAVAEWESDMISTRTKEGMAAKKARGESNPGPAPVGKRKFGKKFIDDPTDREVCRKIVQMRDNGYTQYAIFCHLRKHGMVRYNGKPWDEWAIRAGEKAERQRQHDEAARAALDRERFGLAGEPGVADTAPF